MKVIVSGFDVFGNDSDNPSLEIMKRLPKNLGDIEIYAVEVPTQAAESVRVLTKLVDEIKADVVINMGVARGRESISLEVVAINVDDFRIADNAGYQPRNIPIEKEGADGYFSTLPIHALQRILTKEGHKVDLSYSAGTFVCNHVMYAMQYLTRHTYPHIKAGFVHVPAIQKEGTKGMPLDDMVSAMLCLIAHVQEDEVCSEGGTLW